jgi:hypothetical protein
MCHPHNLSYIIAGSDHEPLMLLCRPHNLPYTIAGHHHKAVMSIVAMCQEIFSEAARPALKLEVFI